MSQSKILAMNKDGEGGQWTNATGLRVKNGALRLWEIIRIDEKSIFRQVVGHILLTVLSFYSDLSEVDALRIKSVDVFIKIEPKFSVKHSEWNTFNQ